MCAELRRRRDPRRRDAAADPRADARVAIERFAAQRVARLRPAG